MERLKQEYRYVKRKGDDQNYIVLHQGKYSGVVYHYGKITINEEEGQARLSFDYTIVDDNGYEKGMLETPEFKNVLGDVLVEELDDYFKEQENNESND